MRRSPAWITAGALAALLAAGSAAAALWPSPAVRAAEPVPRLSAPAAPPPTTATAPSRPVPAAPAPSLIATLSAPTTYSATPGGPVRGTVGAANPFGARQVLAVVERSGGWLRVELPVRPNGSTGWIPASAATLSETSYSVRVDLAARTLTVDLAGRPVLSTPVAVGTPASPTPPDHTYLWELIRPDNPAGAYGPYIFGLAEFSDTYAVFNGGDAQIGIHGSDEPWSIGHAASHGCVRLPNPVIARLAAMLPLGTPVTIG